MAIIGISGKIGSGKDTLGKIIQYLTSKQYSRMSYSSFCLLEERWYNPNDYQIKKFAFKLKQIVSILTGIPIEDLEKEEVKNKLLGEEWTRYGYADGFWRHSNGDTIMHNQECSKEKYEEELKINWQTAYKQEYTPRILLQYIGTDLFRDKLLNNIWVNALFADYIPLDDAPLYEGDKMIDKGFIYPNWIITDVRFPNELKAVKDRDGIIIRVNRSGLVENNHISETALDNAEFDYIIENNGAIEELIEKVKQILIKENII